MTHRTTSPLSVLSAPFEQLVTLDFETYYDDEYGLSKLTTSEYVRDERFEMMGVGVKVNDAPSVWLSERDWRRWIATVDWSRTAVLAHHTHFDGLICAHHFGIKPAFWFDTMSMGRMLHGIDVGGSLAKLATHYQVGEKGHEVESAKGLHAPGYYDLDAPTMTPAQWMQYGAYCNNDVELASRIFERMLAGFPELELWSIDSTIRMYTEPSLVIDEPLLQDFLKYEQGRKAELVARVAGSQDPAVVRQVLGSNERLVEAFREFGAEPKRKKSPSHKCRSVCEKDHKHRSTCVCASPCPKTHTWAFAKSDPAMQALLEHPIDEVRYLAEARVAIKSTINETRTGRMLSIGRGGRPFPIYLQWHKAHTGRWAGGDKVNSQNWERINKAKGQDGKPLKPWAGTIRKAIMAVPGKRLAVADSNAIEARVNAWFAGHQTLVDAFATNADIYSQFASLIYNRPVNRKRELPDGSKPDEGPGFVGKVSILGLGYQMGVEKFALTLLAGPMGAAPIQFTAADARAMGVDVAGFAVDPDTLGAGMDAWHVRKRANNWRMVKRMPSRLSFDALLAHTAVAAHIVRLYRETNQPIVELWSTAEDVLEAMLEGTGEVFGPGGCIRILRHALLLPSGRTLRYPGLDRRKDDAGRESFSYVGGYGGERKYLYGGKLVENIVQAIARDVINEQMLWLRADGFHTAMTTHDELALALPAGQEIAAVPRMVEIMKLAPMWAPGLPLNAEGGSGDRYGSAK